MLLIVGFLLSATSFAAVISMPELSWHGARDAELRATYETYQDTGTLLIKPTGSGSYGVQRPAPGPLTSATWDDDPGAYVIASLMSHVTGSTSPYPGLELAQALLVALPLLWLPIAVARVFKRVRAGLALLLLPPIVWLLNHRTVLLGTEYGLSDPDSPMRVYALYGIAASLAFLSLSLILLLSTYRLRLRVLLAATLLVGVLAGVGNLTRSLSGMGIAVAVGILWWIHASGRWRWVAAVAASALAIIIALAVQSGVMGLVNSARVEATGQSIQEVPDAHTAWHSLYLGLSYPTPITGAESRFDVVWSDEFGWEKAREVDPDVLVASEEYDEILKNLYLNEVLENPTEALELYVLKGIFLIKHFGAMIAFAVAGFALAFIRHPRLRKPLGTVIAISLPTLVLGAVPPVLVMPLLYYYSELSAALGLATAVSVGALAWSLTSLPSQVRAKERNRLRSRPLAATIPTATRGLSVIIPWRNDEHGIETEVAGVAQHLTSEDEIIVVEAGPIPATSGPMQRLSEGWSRDCRLVRLHSQPGLGEALRTGVLASTGRRILLVVEPSLLQPDLAQLTDQLGVLVASVPVRNFRSAGEDWRSASHTRFSEFLREALLRSHGARDRSNFLVDGAWGRAFARLSRESGPLWMDELVVAAEHQGLPIVEVPAQPRDQSPATGSISRRKGSIRTCLGILRLALHKDDYRDEVWAGEPATTS